MTNHVSVADFKQRELKEEAWLDEMISIRAAMRDLIDEGPTPEMLELAKQLADDLREAVSDFLKL